jgi:hypothetical protein
MDIALPSRPPRLARPRILGIVAGVSLALGAVAIFSGHSGSGHVKLQALPPVVTQQGMLEQLGARVTRVAASGDGGLLDVRFQVVDSDLAAAMHSPKTPPALVDEHSGQVIGRLFMGHAHTGRFKAGVTYSLLFEDPGGLVKRGDPVSVVLGPARLQHVRVQ